MFNQRVASAKFMAEAHRRATRMHRALGEEIRRLREDAGIARSGLAAAAGIDLAWEGWAHLGPVVTTSQLLIIRSTKTTRQVGRDFQRQLTAAYPAHPADAIAALAGTAAWPGAALIWAEIERERVRFVERR